MSKRPLRSIIRDWNTKITRPSRKTAFQIRKAIKETPDSLESKLYTNPYASILASPLRKCSFHSRVFPSKLLLRFGLALHPETSRNWAFPTLRKTSGFGYYVNAKKDVLQEMQKGAYQAIFRGAATYRSDMVEHVQNAIFQQSYTEFCKHPVHIYDILTPLAEKQWKGTAVDTIEYQCILAFDATDAIVCELDHQIRSQLHVPCYNMSQFWPQKSIENLKLRLNMPKESSLTLGVPRSMDTVQLANDLWHCRQFIA
ncbi:hypothetical protein BD408DRAFT_442494 [Parasitella parasitica]|nr:hypothetical protein BD408DRAFT_442494 [Parasitella parasitica]